jgi:cobyrinic acid a,c-diamide synthase
MSAHARKIPQFLIAAPSSGSGKTTVSIGLMQCLAQRGLKVQPFKCGPDYIDTKFHQKVCNVPSYNLDTFFASPEHIRNIFAEHAQNADVCIVEGMMGLFDGYNRSKGSASEIASILNLPVILVVDAKSTAYSLAPLLKGFKDYSNNVNIIGVVFNKVGSPRHRKMLEEVCQDINLEALGFIPKAKEAENKSRYLGLDFSAMQMAESASKLVEGNVDIERLLSLTEKPVLEFSSSLKTNDTHKVLVARNEESFSFIYQEHLDGWKNVDFFNPEEDLEIPQDIDLLYLPGGYPEKHLEALSKCRKTMESIRRYAEGGGKILAECGGMMYLCRSILSDEGEFPMCGVLPYGITARTEDRKLCLGYRTSNFNGIEVRGHEFHYTKFTDPQPESSTIRIKNTIASYTHLYWGDKDIFGIF